MSDPEDAPIPVGPAKPFDRKRLTLLLVPVGVFTVLSYAGTILSARLISTHPLLLIALDARLRHLLLAVAADVDIVPFFIVGLTRLVIADPIFYLLGYWYGDAGLRWMEQKAGGTPAYVRWVERWFPKASHVLVAALPNNLVCLLAGTTGMRPRTFFALNIGGTIARLAVVWWLGKALEEPLDKVLDFLQRYQWPVTAVLVGIVVVQSTRQAARATMAEIRAEAALEQERAAAEAAATVVEVEPPSPHDAGGDDHAS